MDSRKATGNEGESLAAQWLSEQGHTVLARNWRAGHLELDIITSAPDGVHFVEVKTRRPPYQAEPQDCVTVPKQRKLASAANAWLNTSKPADIVDAECHFDIVAVVMDKNHTRIQYFPDAFYPFYL